MIEPSTYETEMLEAWIKKTRQKVVNNIELLVSNGTLIKTDKFMEYLGWTWQTISNAPKTQRVFSVEIPGDAPGCLS